MTRLHLIDATYELFRAWFALPSMRAPDGQEVGAVYGLVSSLLKLLREPGVTHMACATDHTVTSFRNELWPGYKTGDGVEPDLLAQFPLAEEALRAAGLVVWPMVEFEADDALGTAAARFAPECEQVLICTPDKDLAQCVVGQQVVLWDRRREAVYDAAAVEAKWGVPPASIADLLALTGDAADGYPGVPGWGLKSSAALLQAYGQLEAIPPDPAAWTVKVRGAARLARSLAEHAADATLFKVLATVRRDVPLPEGELEQLRWRGADPEAFPALCQRLGFERLASRPSRWRS